jgi:hypothetical protein
MGASWSQNCSPRACIGCEEATPDKCSESFKIPSSAVSYHDELSRELLISSLFEALDPGGSGFLSQEMPNAKLFINMASKDTCQVSDHEFLDWARLHLLPVLSNDLVERINKLFKLAAACNVPPAYSVPTWEIFDVFDIDEEDGASEVLGALRDIVVGPGIENVNEGLSKAFNEINTVVSDESFVSWTTKNEASFIQLTELLAAIDQLAVEMVIRLLSKAVANVQAAHAEGGGEKNKELPEKEVSENEFRLGNVKRKLDKEMSAAAEHGSSEAVRSVGSSEAAAEHGVPVRLPPPPPPPCSSRDSPLAETSSANKKAKENGRELRRTDSDFARDAALVSML